jgi:hypothetical protein
MYRKTARGWTRRVMVGSQSVENVEQFINEGVASDDTDSKPADAADTADKAKPAEAAKPAAETGKEPKA